MSSKNHRRQQALRHGDRRTFSSSKFYTGKVFHPEPVVHNLEINQGEQPWQKKERKDRERLAKHPHLGWNDRRYIREEAAKVLAGAP